MSVEFDFGFEVKGVAWTEAVYALMFASQGEVSDFGKVGGPLAIADASRFIELFEMQLGLSPLEIGTYSEISGGDDPLVEAVSKAREALAGNILPVIIADDRRATIDMCTSTLVALWGKVGRAEADEAHIFEQHTTILGGVRAATSVAFQAIPPNVTLVTSRALSTNTEIFKSALQRATEPVHLSIDLDVLAPGVVQNSRSLEPGGLSWYELMDAIELVFEGPGVSSADLVGTAVVEPRSPASILCAQILIKLAGLHVAGLEK
jgi:arginase family protein